MAGIGEALRSTREHRGLSIDQVAQDTRISPRFLEALDQLPPRCRQVFLLQRYDDLTYTSIAKRLSISVSAVEKHMMRALLHFQAQLAEP